VNIVMLMCSFCKFYCSFYFSYQRAQCVIDRRFWHDIVSCCVSQGQFWVILALWESNGPWSHWRSQECTITPHQLNMHLAQQCNESHLLKLN